MPEQEISLVPGEQAYLNDILLTAKKIAKGAANITPGTPLELFETFVSIEELKSRTAKFWQKHTFLDLFSNDPTDILRLMPEAIERYSQVLTAQKDELIQKLLENHQEDPNAAWEQVGRLRVGAAELYRAKK